MKLLDRIDDMFTNPQKYAKFWVAFAGFAVSMLTTYIPDAPWLPVVTQALTAAGVYQVRNKKTDG